MEEDSTQSKQFTLIDLTTLALITAVVAVLSFRNWNLESVISQQKKSQREEITLIKKTYESQISQLHKEYQRQLSLKEAEIRGLERGVALSR